MSATCPSASLVAHGHRLRGEGPSRTASYGQCVSVAVPQVTSRRVRGRYRAGYTARTWKRAEMDRSSEDTTGKQVEAPSSMKAYLSVDVHGSPIAQARHLAVSFLSTVRDTHDIPVTDSTVEIVQLIVSELVTNARKYAPGPALLELHVT